MSIAGRIENVKDLETLSVQAAELNADHIGAADDCTYRATIIGGRDHIVVDIGKNLNVRMMR